MRPDIANRVPSLAPGIRLYCDDQSHRWVVKAPRQVVFLDPLSLDVLRACNGCRDLMQIALYLELFGQRSQPVELEQISDVVRHFESRGMLRCRPVRPALAVSAP